MAAPAEITISSLSGKFVLNKKLSQMDNSDQILQLQGVGWLTRKAISSVTPTLEVTHGTTPWGASLIEVAQTAGPQRMQERRELDDVLRERENKLFGSVRTKARFAPVAEVPAELQGGWDADEVVLIHVESVDATWACAAVWGFKEVEGARRYMRAMKVDGPKGEKVVAQLCYDYTGPV